jgi:ubiquitin-protein ligase
MPSSSVPVPSGTGEDVKVRLGRQRLLLDIQELVKDPYPRISLHICEEDLTYACLVLYPEYYPPLHMGVHFSPEYPIRPPTIHMDTSVSHPNVFGSYICATILNTREDYTPAYTLKGIAIQMLSFFDSESLEQDHGLGKQDLITYQDMNSRYLRSTYKCNQCQFGKNIPYRKPKATRWTFDARVDRNPEQWPTIQQSVVPLSQANPERPRTSSNSKESQESRRTGSRPPRDRTGKNGHIGFDIDRLPNEILLLIIEQLDDFEHLTSFARAWTRISHLVQYFNVIRQRELQCFCLKQGYQLAKLGVGVAVLRGQISSEFDLISQQAYETLNIRMSVHNIPFEYWLPLPISQRHWGRVKGEAHNALAQIKPLLKASTGTSDAQVLFTFMNDIVVRLNQVTEQMNSQDSHKSTLRHASEKAIESYFHLFHLLVCLATENPSIVEQANKLLKDFEKGKQSKNDCPNLGHLLIALLISDVQVTEALIKSIITEAITRNVVWLLDSKGTGMAELSYMERDAVSAYRLEKTFRGSRTSYRLLMFSELFRRTARPSHEKTLLQVRDELFDRHGAPPRDAAGQLAAEVRRLQTIDDFPAFMKEMGLRNIPSPANFSGVLRTTVHASMAKGYSKWAMDQRKAMCLRFKKDPYVQLTKEEREWAVTQPSRGSSRHNSVVSFFPNKRATMSGGGKSPRQR